MMADYPVVAASYSSLGFVLGYLVATLKAHIRRRKKAAQPRSVK